MSSKKIIKKVEKYLTIPSVVRFENSFMNYLENDFNLPDYDIEKQDRLLIIKRKNSKSSVILTAHIDRIGIIVNGDGKFEYAWVRK